MTNEDFRKEVEEIYEREQQIIRERHLDEDDDFDSIIAALEKQCGCAADASSNETNSTDVEGMRFRDRPRRHRMW